MAGRAKRAGRRRTFATTTTCNGKTRFRDKREALHRLHNIEVHGVERAKKPVRAYECPSCKGWHLTSQP